MLFALLVSGLLAPVANAQQPPALPTLHKMLLQDLKIDIFRLRNYNSYPGEQAKSERVTHVRRRSDQAEQGPEAAGPPDVQVLDVHVLIPAAGLEKQQTGIRLIQLVRTDPLFGVCRPLLPCA